MRGAADGLANSKDHETLAEPKQNGDSPALVLTTAELPPPGDAIAVVHDEAHLDLEGRLLE